MRRHTHEGKAKWRRRRGLESAAVSQEHLDPLEAGRGILRAFADVLILDFWPPQKNNRIRFCGAKPFSGWQFVTTAQGSLYPLSELLLHWGCPPRYLFLKPLCPCVLDFVVQSLSCVRLFSNPWISAHQAPLSSTISRSLFKFRSTESVIPSNHLILCHPLLLLPSVFPSVRVFSSALALCIRWPKDWSFSFSISPSNEFAGLISFRTDRFDLLAVH